MRSLTAKVILILLLSSTAAFCQDFNIYPFTMMDYSLLGSGARARAMGGAFTGVADDASALTWNPAGLIQVDKIQASVSGVYLPLQLQTNLSYANNSSHNIQAKFKDNKLKPDFASFAAPIRIKGHPFMASVTYQSSQNQLNDEYSAADSVVYYAQPIPQDSIHQRFGTFESRRTVKGGTDVFSFGFGTGLYGDVAVGAAVNIYTGSTESFFRGEMTDSFAVMFGRTYYKSVQYRIEKSVFDKADSKGFNFTTSLFYRKDKLRAGITVKTPFQMITDHDLIRRDTLYLKNVEEPGGGLPTNTVKPSLFRGKTKIDVPLSASMGVSFQALPNLVLAGDVSYAGFSKAKYYIRSEQKSVTSLDSINTFTLPGSMYYNDSAKTSYFTSAGELIEIFNEYALNLENSLQARFGGEYTLKTNFGIVPLRAGFRIVQGPYREVTGLVRDDKGQPRTGYVLGKKVSHSVAAAGAGIHWRQVWLDFALEYNTEKQTESGTTVWGNFVTEKKRSGASLFFNFTGFF